MNSKTKGQKIALQILVPPFFFFLVLTIGGGKEAFLEITLEKEMKNSK